MSCILPGALFLLFFFSSSLSFAEDLNIDIISDKVIGEINPLIMGSSISAYYFAEKDYKINSNYGAGIWDPERLKPVAEIIDLAKNIHMSILRFPGVQQDYKWKNTIGPTGIRPNYLFGIDEFLKTAEEIGSEVIYTLPFFKGTPQDAADLVEYLNAESDSNNPGGGTDWADERAKNGHPEPYKVKYFELGNEVNFGIPRKGISGVDPATYAKKYLEYKKAMKAIDTSILLGAVTVNSGNVYGISAWNDKVFKIAGSQIDFLIQHTYRPRVKSNNEKAVDIDRLFKKTMASISSVDMSFKKLSKHFESVTGRKNIPLAITEYNSGFGQKKSQPFRHSLGTALLNAGLLQIFMRPENNILMANNHQFINIFWGAIKIDKLMGGRGHYTKRPNYYTLEMFSRHFGNELIDVRIKDSNVNDNLDSSKRVDMLSNVSWKRKIVFGADIDVLRDGTIKVGFDGNKDINFHHMLKKVSAKPDTTYLLSGYLRAENLVDEDYEGVGLVIQDGRGWQLRNNESTEKIWGTTDWVRVELEYTTLSDTSGLYVLIRRRRGGGTIAGKVYVRDVKLIEKQPSKEQGKDNLMISASIEKATNNLYVMVLNKSMSDDIRAFIKIKNNELRKKATVWTLNGPNVWSLNETEPETVTIKEASIEMNNDKQVDYVFPAHSLTSLEFKLMN